ncbi:phospho-N-acetylmuramoyl-pentapeptide-transferase [soil metagenome]
MIPLIAQYFSGDAGGSFLRLLDYITVRSGLALVWSFVFCVILGPRFIERMRAMQAIQPMRTAEGEGAISLGEMHKHKGPVPTMGGVLMLGGLLSAVLLFGSLTQPVLLLALFAAIGYGGVGFVDDYLKVVKKNSGGLSARKKIVAQFLLGTIFAIVYTYIYPHLVSYNADGATAGPTFLLVPFFKDVVVNLGIFYVPFAIFVLISMSNAVNLTDGLDGLAAGVTISSALCFALVAYLVGRESDSRYLLIPHVVGAGELTVLLAALCGACFGFLWFNSHPAQVFMGDTGSMMLGGLLGAVALLIKQEFLLVVVGGVFVAEALSVVLQVGSYKLRKKRIFRMAPLHHHFERGGVPESKIIARFYIVSALLALAGLVTLKLR